MDSSIDVDTPTTTAPDWTIGPAKWAAVFILGAAAIFCTVWSITMRERRPAAPALPTGLVATQRTPSVTERAPAPSAPAPVPPSSPPASSSPPPPALAPAVPSDEPPQPSPPTATTVLINLNTATQAQLELLPGIGPALAIRIIEYRTTSGPFKKIDDLDHVKGIGPAKLEKIRPFVTVGP